jgi:transposase InsO family protein
VALTGGIITLAAEYGRHGYRRITALLWAAGWAVNVKRVERIWRQEGLKVPHRQPRKGRLWLNDGSCVHLRPERPNHVWSYDFVEGRTHDGRKLRMLNVIDEFTRECLVIRVARKLKSTDVIDVLTGLFILRGAPGHIRSDNGPEFIAKTVRQWIAAVGADAAFIEPGSPWENRYCESCNSKLHDELLNGEIFHSLAEARVVIEGWRQHYNTVRPHSSLGYKPPAPSAKTSPPERAQPATQVTVEMADEPTMHQVSPRTTSWGQTRTLHAGYRVRYSTNVMNVDIFEVDRRRTGCTTANLRAAVATTLLVLLGGCGGQRVAATGDQPASAGQPPSDAIGTFASRASLNEEALVVLPDGQAATLRMARRYSAASGRDCSEVIIRTAAARRAQIFCRGEQGAWLAARPLLRGG